MSTMTDIQRYPLSFHQERLWFIDRFETRNVYSTHPVYHNLPIILKFDGALNPDSLSIALNEAVSRHDALRSRVVDEGDRHWIDVEDHVEVPLAVVDERETGNGIDWREWAEREALKPFDLSRDLMLRAALRLMSSIESVLVLTLHHFAADRASLRCLVDEIRERYEALEYGRMARETGEPVRYTEAAAWQHSLTRNDFEPLLFHWRWQLRGRLQPLELPEDIPRPAIHTYTAGRVEFDLPRETRDALGAECARLGVETRVAWLAAYAVLLHRLSLLDEIVIGVPFENRLQPGLENAIGPYSNLNVLRLSISNGMTLADAIEETQKKLDAADEYQEMPFDLLVQELKPQKDMSRTALFDVLFQHQRIERPLSFNGARAEWVETNLGDGKYDFNLMALDDGERARGLLTFNLDIYRRENAERMARCCQRILEAMTGDLNQPLGRIDLLSDEDKRLELSDWNRTEADCPTEATVASLFDEQVLASPDACALIADGDEMSYRELDRAANRVAHVLRGMGVREDDLVAVCLGRSADAIVALLGVVKAGGAYLPLNPEFPEERLRFTLDDSGASFLVSTSEYVHALPVAVRHTLLLDRDAGQIDAAPDSAPQTELKPDSLLYCLYTSGSTGKPKGVLIEHRNVVRLLRNSAMPFSFGPDDVWTVFHSFTFDFSVWELYGALLNGGAAVLVAQDAARDPDAFLDVLQRHRVTVLNQTPSAFYALIEAARRRSFPSLAVREIVFGGEALNPKRLIDWREAYPQARLVNMYGITETTVHVTFKELSRDDLNDSASAIGLPIPATTVILMDEHGQLVPPGAPGEMMVGGLGLGRGYLGRDELTRERFIDHPFKPGERLYRSGDLARRRWNGELVYLGRIDDQVQVRGFRIETGEIEARLLDHDAVREASVQPCSSEDGGTALAAYVSFSEDVSLTELRAHLVEALPEYMVPAYIVPVPRIPLTVNGKVDREALPDPLAHRMKADSSYAAPRNEIETRLAGIWSETLEVERVGIHDNFFELGGHSILATRLMARIRQAFSVELPLRRIFEAPTVAQLAGFIGEEDVEADSIPAAKREGPAPLSYAQRRLWVLNQLEGPSGTYNVSTALRIHGDLNRKALEEAFRQVIKRHEILRSAIDTLEGQPVQRALDGDEFTLSYEELINSGLDARSLEEKIQEEIRRPFSLKGEALLRARLLKTGDDEYVFVLTLHHIITDGWSQSILVNEIAEAYEACLGGLEPDWAPLPIQYADYAVWQQNWIESGESTRQLEFWKSAMKDAPPLLELPTDRPRPQVQRFEGSLRHVRFPSELTAKLKRFSRDHDVTLFMTLHAAFATLLARLSGQTDIVTGTGVANRRRGELEPLIGFFVNTLLLRLDLSDEPSFVDLVKQAQERDLAAFEHQDIPFETLVDALQPERDLSHSPLFQVMFTLQNTPDAAPRLPGLAIEALPIDPGVSKFDITVLLHEEDGGLAGVVEFSDALFNESTIVRMMACYERLLESLVSDPEQPAMRAAMLPEREEAALHYWSGRETNYPRNATIVDVFHNIAAVHAARDAVCFGDDSITYAELDRRSELVAYALTRRGVSRGDVVGVLMERGLDAPAALLGVLKTGAAYAPLDPGFPPERLALMARDASMKIVVHDRDAEPGFSQDVDFVLMQQCLAEPVDSNDERRCEAGAEDPAYVIYTSGSTGEPKGVAVPHRGVTRLALETDYCPIDPSDRIAHASTVTFDAATFEIWGALLNGAAVVCLSRDEALNPRRFKETLDSKRITTLFLTTALFNEIARQAPDSFAGLRHLLFGGEAVDPKWVRRVLDADAPDRLLHVYGPTENTTFSTWHRVRTVEPGQATVPIGQAIANSTAYVLDERLQLAPIGAAGELYVGGDGLALGYLNKPEETAKAFVSNPFSDTNERLYRTGDIVRRRADGAIEFIGRRDHQVKVRGFRIELDEIAAHLSAVPGVENSLVVYQDHALTAYLAASDPSLSEASLRQALSAALPDYMIPAFFVFLDEFPLNANGKIDRRALPKPEAVQVETATVEPETDTQRRLAAIWRQVLAREAVGIHDSFFHIGGHSLSATQVVSRIRDEFSIELPLRTLFQSPTIAALAGEIDRNYEAAPTAPITIPVIERGGRHTLSFAQERLWFLDKIEPDNPFYNVSIALDIRGVLNVEAFRQSFGDVMARHEILRATFLEEDGTPYLEIQPDSEFEFPVETLGAGLDGDVEAALMGMCIDEARRPFDLQRGPLIRVRLLKIEPERHVLLLSMHHIISDGWSLGVLVHEWLPLYQRRCGEQVDPPPEPVIQYVDFAAWQREWLSGATLDRQCDYWKRKLDGAPPVLQLPTDRPRPPAQSFRGGGVRFSVSARTAAGLRRLSEQSEATLYMTLLSGFAALLFRYSGQRDMVIGSPIANRTRNELEPLIGFFVNTLAMRIQLDRGASFTELLEQARDTALEAFAHQDLPFEKLVDELDIERDLSVNPLFQVMFALQNAPIDEIRLPGLDVAMVDTPRVTALFDLVMDMWETGDTLTGVLEYNADLFDEASIQRMADHYVRILDAAAEDAAIRVDEIPLLSSDEEHRLLHEWAGPVRDYPVDQPIHALFEREAARAPERTAAVHYEQTISYDALNRRANQLAHRLRRLGIKPNDFVGVLVPRSIDCLAAMLAILKAGGAFTPIDPAYPDERIRYMIRDSRIRVLIASSSTAAVARDAEDDSSLEHVTLIDADDMSAEPEANPQPVTSPRDFAYMLYTSGSTGLPKGAIVRHDGAVNHMFAEFELLNFARESAFLQSAPSSSDISVWQFLAPGVIGARTVIVDYETVCDPQALFEEIKTRRVSLIELVPVVMKEMLEYARGLSPDERALPDLDMAMATGESVPVTLVNQWLEMYPGIPIVNAYGPTEAADDVCQLTISEPLHADARSVPIGRALQNLRMYVLDENLRLVPIGAAGELCVAGIGVGAGYFNQPEKTRAAFVPNPYAQNEHDQLLYRTGDLGFWRADGLLECMERLDFQVKIRGFRIELGEIEGALTRHPAIKEAVARVHGEAEDKFIAAYVTVKADAAETLAMIDSLTGQQVELWQNLHEDSYVETLTYGDDTFNVIGWDSNYTSQPLPERDMHEYVNFSVERILALKPRRLYEIGCGTGLIAFPLIPHLKGYEGVDASSVAVGQLQSLQKRDDLRERVRGLDRAVFACRLADDFSAVEAGGFDTAILPSVVQYFPGIDYLTAVIEGLCERLAPGGSIFIGDVRNLKQLEMFHASVQFYKAEPDMTMDELAERIRRQLESEQEMAIEPEYFFALAESVPQISHVEILPKRGTQRNEMTCFRYDVVLHLAESIQLSEPESWSDWSPDDHSLERIASLIASPGFEGLALRRIANARVERDNHLMELLNAPGQVCSVGEAREQIDRFNDRGIDPEELIQLASEHGLSIELCLSTDGERGAFDAVISRSGGSAKTRFVNAIQPKLMRDYANNPLQEKFQRRLASELRDFCSDRLPAYMTPSAFVTLDAMPLTPAGKIDRLSLKPPADAGARSRDEYVAPVADDEKQVCRILAEVLGLDQMGMRDHFFECGGHSLKATQAVSRLQRDIGAGLNLRDLFSHPTPAELMPLIRASGGKGAAAIERTPDAPHYPLSHGQRRLWVLSQMEGASSAYNMPAALSLEGDIDIGALARAFERVQARHESLRTAFRFIDGEPRQVVLPEPGSRLNVIDMSDRDDAEAAAREFAAADAAAPFDFEAGCLVRATLVRLSSRRHILVFNMHHIISDELSMNVLVGEFVNAIRQPSSVDKPPGIHYRDFAVWQNRFIESEAGAGERDFWLGELSGGIPVLELPCDYPRPPVKTFNGACVPFHVSIELERRVQSLCAKTGCSRFVFFSALIHALLRRYSGQDDIITGYPVSGRTHADLEGQIGFYVNTLPLRIRMDASAAFIDLLDETNKRIQNALDRQNYPFDRLVDEVSAPRDVSRSPLFDVVIVMQEGESEPLSLPGVEINTFVDEYPMAKFDLAFNLQSGDDGLKGDIVYNTDLFKPDSIERMCGHLVAMLEAALERPETEIGRLNWLTEHERAQALADSRPKAVDMPLPYLSLAKWFEAQVGARPDAVAIRSLDESGSIQSHSYRELDALADRLARRLIERGVKPGGRAGVFVERNHRLPAAILAVVKTGAAYVPFDPAHPPARIAFMIEDAGIDAILTESSLNSALPDVSCEMVLVDRVDGDERIPVEAPAVEIDPDSAAYVIYTSGTTGKPKGVQVSHRNVMRLFSQTESKFGFGPDDVWTMFHSAAFDFSVWELWGALLYGGRLVVVPYAQSRSPDEFHRLACDEGVTVLNQTPSAFRQLMQADEASAATPLALRYVIFGGEALEFSMLRPWFERHGDRAPRLVNMFGITETTVHVTWREIDADDARHSHSLIGEPIDDLGLLILDENQAPCPIGVAGELYVCGAGVSLGYLNRPELTRERFIANPLTGDEHDRCYRTGDLARRLVDGDIEYLGRIDQQVQLRGFRIELGEIESALKEHDNICEAIVRMTGDSADRRLGAWCVTDRDLPSYDRLREWLLGCLPEYMVPSFVLTIDAVPLTPNGKLDLAALPQPSHERPELSEAFVEPRSELETLIAGLFSSSLGLEAVGVRDNFFDLGANSMTLVQISIELKSRLNKEISVVNLFQHPTIESLARFLTDDASSQGSIQTTAKERAAKRAQARKSARSKRKR